MRIFYFARIDISLEDAGTRHVFEVCRQFARSGHEVFLFVPDLGHRRPLEGVTFVHVPVAIRKSSFTFFSFYFFLFFYFLYYYFRFKPDVVYTRHQQMEWLVAWLKLALGFVYVIEVNGLAAVEMRMSSVASWVISVTQCMERLVFRLPDKIVASSVQIRDAMCRDYDLHKENFLVVSNGADPETFRPMDQKLCRERLGLKLDRVYLVFTGSFKKWHGLDQIVRAMLELVEKIPPVYLIVVGDGEEKPAIERLIFDLQLSGRIALVGKKPFDEIPCYLGAADICLGSFIEKPGISPLKIFEYMACGKPIVSNAVGGLDLLFNSWKPGELVYSSNPSEWAGRIGRLLDDPRRMRQYGENGRKAVMREFNWESVCGKIEKTLESILSSKSK